MLIYWHKRDLRLLDNPALGLALDLCRQHDLQFVPIAGLETDLINSELTSYEFGQFYQYGFLSAVIPLIKNYNYFGIQAQLFYEPILDILYKLNQRQAIKILVSHQEHGTSGTFERDKAVHQFCQEHSITWYQIAPSGVIRNLKSRDTRDKAVKEYLNSKILPIPSFGNINQPEFIDNSELLLHFENIQDGISKNHQLQSCSEKLGLACLESFTIERAVGYRSGISSPNSAFVFGSRLSQYLAFGSVSLRYAYQYFWNKIKSSDNKKIRAGILAAITRLYWREHFIQRLETDPDMPIRAIHPDYDKISYDNQYFEAYKAGQTGEPIIDACIRCLHCTGFINFRMRAMLISYGIFGLDIDWRDLGKFLATLFLDYEPGIHWSQVQMQSGVTGINTIRVYSPQKQLLDQDPECTFVKKWIPELATLSIEQIQNYVQVDLSKLTKGKYPYPVVDFKVASKINKTKIYNLRSSTTKESSQKVFIKHGSRKPKRLKTIKTSKKITNKTIVRVVENKGLFDSQED